MYHVCNLFIWCQDTIDPALLFCDSFGSDCLGVHVIPLTISDGLRSSKYDPSLSFISE